ncbi:MAG: hypothetical protein ABH952_10735 [Candidatus Omnitrophota bacterium]
MMGIIKGFIDGNPEMAGIIISTVIIGLVNAVKQTGISPRTLPFFAIVFGVLISVIGFDFNDIKKEIVIGIWLGLGAVGLHSGLKNTLFNGEPPNNNNNNSDNLSFYKLKK